jgi:peptidyl-prolyl cis-trans isomerase SurA
MKYIFSLFIAFTSISAFAQPKIIDGVIAVVGDKKILQSDVENQFFQMKAQGMKVSSDTKCQIFEELLAQKLLVNQAEVDSIEVSEGEIQMALDQRLQYFIAQIGSQKKLEEYFGKTIYQIKDDMYSPVKEQIITERMQAEIIGSIDVTPSEVKQFYKEFPEDSIPFINGTLEFSQIVIYPPYGEKAVYEVRQKLLDIRKRILEGDNFKTMAVLYSEGPSSSRGGELGFAAKAELDPEYARVAFALKEGQVSKIVETDFGYHIIQMIERRGDRVNTRHIIMKPKVSADSKVMAIEKLDSIRTLIEADSITFEQAAMKLSEDDKSNVSGGRVVNMQTGNYKWEIDHFNPQEYAVLKDLEEGEISEPFASLNEHQKEVYKIVMIRAKTPPHKANLKQDYTLFKAGAKNKKQMELLDEWILEKMEATYIQIGDSYKGCKYRLEEWSNK